MDQLGSNTFEMHQKNYGQCKTLASENLDHVFTIDGSNRQARLHTCFENCKDYIYDEFKTQFTLDTRPNCTDLAAEDERYLICLYADDECEHSALPEEAGWGNFLILPSTGVLAVIIATPCQFLFELLCIYLVKIRTNTEKVSENCKILTF
jgi:hypothetical protein